MNCLIETKKGTAGTRQIALNKQLIKKGPTEIRTRDLLITSEAL